jgi:hypothetical protein
MADVKAMINPNEDIFTKEELISIKVTMQFMQEKFYNDEADKSSDTYKQLITIRNKCIDALEK